MVEVSVHRLDSGRHPGLEWLSVAHVFVPPWDERSDRLAERGPTDVAFLIDVEDKDGHPIVHAQAHRRRVERRETLREDIGVGERFVSDRRWVLDRIFAVDAVDLGGLQQESAARFRLPRSAAAVSVVKKGLPVPAARARRRPFSRCRTARAPDVRLADRIHPMASHTRVSMPCRLERPAAHRPFITVASMPM